MILIERKDGAKPLNVSLDNQILLTPHLIKIEGKPQDIVNIERDGNNLIVTFASGKKVIFYGFYNENKDGLHSELVFEDDDGQLFWLNGNEFVEVTIDPALVPEVAGGVATESEVPAWILPLLGAGILGSVLATSASSSSNDVLVKNPVDPIIRPEKPGDVTFENQEGGSTIVKGNGEEGSTVIIKDKEGNEVGRGEIDGDGKFEVEIKDGLEDGKDYDVIVKDPAGNESDPTTITGDTTAPDAPTELAITNQKDRSTMVTGKGEPNAEVIIRDKAGKEVGRGKVDKNGDFEVNVKEGLLDSKEYDVVLKNSIGNESEAGTVIGDTTPPKVPSGLAISEDGLTLLGNGEPHSKVIIKNDQGEVIGEAVVETSGQFTAKLTKPTNGGYIYISAKDDAGNESVSKSYKTPPLAPKDVVVASDGLSVSGKGEPNAKVIIKNNAGREIATGTVNSDGTFKVDLKSPTNGSNIKVSLEDAIQNKSPEVEKETPDKVAPEKPTDIEYFSNTKGEIIIKGKGEIGSKVIIKDHNNGEVTTGKVGTDGTFSINLGRPTDGSTIKISLQDAAENESVPESYIVKYKEELEQVFVQYDDPRFVIDGNKAVFNFTIAPGEVLKSYWIVQGNQGLARYEFKKDGQVIHEITFSDDRDHWSKPRLENFGSGNYQLVMFKKQDAIWGKYALFNYSYSKLEPILENTNTISHSRLLEDDFDSVIDLYEEHSNVQDETSEDRLLFMAEEASMEESSFGDEDSSSGLVFDRDSRVDVESLLDANSGLLEELLPVIDEKMEDKSLVGRDLDRTLDDSQEEEGLELSDLIISDHQNEEISLDSLDSLDEEEEGKDENDSEDEGDIRDEEKEGRELVADHLDTTSVVDPLDDLFDPSKVVF